MAIIQISKLQQRSGNIIDLPQLDEAEFGFATDSKRLFIGKTTPNENIEVLTSYSNISFSQIDGSTGNLNIDPLTLADGQVLAYDGTNWVNRGEGAPGIITLGDVSNIQITGGGIGYVMSTDGTGNLSWSPKGTLYTNIIELTNDTGNGNIIVMTVDSTTPYTNGQGVTITGVDAANANTIVNGQNFYVKMWVDYPTSGNVDLYTDVDLLLPTDGTNLGQPTANGVATSVIASGSGSGAAGGANTSIQYNHNNLLDGDTNLTWDFITNVLTVSGNVNAGNIGASTSMTAPILVSNVATGTAPLTVSSTTRVPNLNASYANVSDYEVVTAQTTGTFYPVLVNGSTTANYALGSNASLSFNVATGNLSTTLLKVTSNANVGNLGASGQLVSSVATGTAPLSVTSTTRVSNLNASYANVSDYEVVTAQTTGTFYPVLVNGSTTANYALGSNASFSVNVATGNLSTTLLNVTSNANVGNLGASGEIAATGNITANNLSVSSGTVTLGALTTGAVGTAGTITGTWTLVGASKLQATYADLAEYYSADSDYAPGTVLEFGGKQEVTLASDSTTRVAGIVSTNPAYVMNTGCVGEYPVAVALQGRVPCKVRGKISKGDLMVSGGNGFARPENYPIIGSILGKSLEDFNGEGTIEVVVGRF